MQRAAVIGGGIAGISSAWHLQNAGLEVDLYEADARLGGHTHTHLLDSSDGQVAVDTGFIVFNQRHYPEFDAWLTALDVASQASDMSFAVSDTRLGLEYGTGGLRAIAAHPGQLARPGYWRLWRDLKRFYRANGSGATAALSLGSYLERHGYSREFTDAHIVPMCAALWSQPADASLNLSMHHVVDFMRNHDMLKISGRPEWRVLQGGSSSYLQAFLNHFNGEIHLRAPVQLTVREDGVAVHGPRGVEMVDAAVVACHSDQALSALRNPSRLQVQVLSRMPYRANSVYLHSDPSFMPKRKTCWSSWNVQRNQAGELTITYWMNRLQSLPGSTHYFVTLNPSREPRQIAWQGNYQHPHFTRDAEEAKTRRWEISGDRIAFAGAYWGHGFHEDGFVSGRQAVEHILQKGLAHAA